MELWAMGAIALLVFYSNYMVAPLIPAFSREFAVLPDALGWLVPGFSIAYAAIYAFRDEHAAMPITLAKICGH
jgi:hypothetical protein